MFDPATPYDGALALDTHVRNPSLLTVEGWGHTFLFLSVCADAVVFPSTHGDRSARDTVCFQAFDPFDIPASPLAPDLDQRRDHRTTMLGHVAYLPPVAHGLRLKRSRAALGAHAALDGLLAERRRTRKGQVRTAMSPACSGPGTCRQAGRGLGGPMTGRCSTSNTCSPMLASQ